MNCREVDELGAAYALDAVEPDERRTIADHLDTCAEPHLEARSTLVPSTLDLDLEPVAPSPALRARLMDSLAVATQDATAPSVTAPAAVSAPQQRRDAVAEGRSEPGRGWFDLSWLRPVAFGGVAASLVLAVAAGVLWTRLQEREAQLRTVADAIAQGGATYSVAGDAGTGVLVDHPEGATVVLAGLSPVGEGQLYELWLLDAAGTPTAVGTHRPSDEQAVVVIPLERDVAGYTTFAVTVERSRVDAPTSDPVIVGQIGG